MPKTTKKRPGNKAEYSGLYEIIGKRGGRTGQERTVVKDEPFPPTPKSDQYFILVEAARNGSGVN